MCVCILQFRISSELNQYVCIYVISCNPFNFGVADPLFAKFQYLSSSIHEVRIRHVLRYCAFIFTLLRIHIYEPMD
jgi:hypothetical protein